ncbi:hypothetical protein BJ875DRAFT_451917 [Amylocarpus encephaloides]|uniref:Uncharacterized protein n=1 Tax=Amylocarpus encephaloides TaxID=45428 RepID=A0A9P7YQH9_9HELO|nr:hypothetical protein BJ875DRAFT_451917 [Amylocarpus encephaloides]
MDDENTESGSHGEPRPTHTLDVAEPLPELHTPHRRRRMIIWIGVTVVIIDLCALPIAYYYAFEFGTNLTTQDIFGIITGIFGLISFTHYAFRSLKLFRGKVAPKWRPVGWSRWGMLEFLHINLLLCITAFEIELIIGTIPHHPWVRLVAMPSPTICFYFGFLLCGTAVLTQMKKRLPFNMSSTPKGSLWKPALLAFVEDGGGIEGQGGVQYREAVMKRYEVSPRFRRMILLLSWIWGLGLIFIAVVSTILIILLNVHIGFGVGWGLPWAFSAVYSIMTVMVVKSQLRKEKAEWREKAAASASSSAATV